MWYGRRWQNKKVVVSTRRRTFALCLRPLSAAARCALQFVLHYRGKLHAAGSPTHKQVLREHFHVQLARLWGQAPLHTFKRLSDAKQTDGEISSARVLAGRVFVPLVTSELHLVADLEIVFLRPEPPGRLITQGGDIDNRMKTLLDALSAPRHANQVVAGSDAVDGPMFCLLEDDNLITSLSVRSEHLLEDAAKDEVELYILVRTRTLRAIWGNVGLG